MWSGLVALGKDLAFGYTDHQRRISNHEPPQKASNCVRLDKEFDRQDGQTLVYLSPASLTHGDFVTLEQPTASQPVRLPTQPINQDPGLVITQGIPC